MARLPVRHEDDPSAPPEVRDLLARVRAGRGELFNMNRVMANHPAALEAFNAFSYATRSFVGGLGNGSLTPEQTELAYTAATVANDCFY